MYEFFGAEFILHSIFLELFSKILVRELNPTENSKYKGSYGQNGIIWLTCTIQFRAQCLQIHVNIVSTTDLQNTLSQCRPRTNRNIRKVVFFL